MKNISKYLKIAVSLALLAALFWIMRDKLLGIVSIIAHAKKPFIAMSVGIFVLCMILQSFRLKLLLDAQGVHIAIRDVTFLTFIGQFFNNFMPTSIGGDVIKAYYASGGTKKKLETFTSVLIDRVLGVITLSWIALAALFLYPDDIANKIVVVIIIIMCVIGTVFTAVIFNKKAARIIVFFERFFKSPRIKDQLQRLYEATHKYRHHKMLLLHAIWISFIAQLMFFYMAYLLAIAISSGVSFTFLMLNMPAISAASMLPSLNGLGIRESGFVYFLGGVMGKTNAFALSLLYLGVMLVMSLVGGVIFLFKREFKHIIHAPSSLDVRL